MAQSTLKEIASILLSAKKIAVLSHMRPDGDALGSVLALSFALEKLEKNHVVCNESDLPSNLLFLDGLDRVKKTVDEDVDVIIALDSADDTRLGALLEVWNAKKRKVTTVNVDHHVSNTRYAKYNFIRECSANCMNVFRLIEALGVSMDEKIANALMVGLLTDSGNFSHDDVTEETFSVAASLVKHGANVKTLNEKLFKTQRKARAGLYAETMRGIRYALSDRFAFIVITQANMQKYGADQGMTEGFVDFPLSIDVVEVSASIMEMKKGQYKISLRSKNYADVNRIAGTYGGGGHVRAAGCMMFGEIEDVLDRLTYTVSQYLE